MKSVRVLIAFFALFIMVEGHANIYQSFEKVTKDILDGRLEQAISSLQNDFQQLGVKKFEEKRDFLLIWAYYFKKEYQKAYGLAKKIVVDTPQSDYYYTALILSARLALKLDDQKGAAKILTWVKNNPPGNKEILLAALILERLLGKGLDGAEEEKKFGLDVFRLSWEAVRENPVKIIEKIKTIVVKKEEPARKSPDEVEKKQPIKKKSKTKVEKSSGSQSESDLKKAQLATVKELEKLKQLIDVKEKELRVMRMLLDEKKRLLELKEKYLAEQENLRAKEEKEKGE